MSLRDHTEDRLPLNLTDPAVTKLDYTKLPRDFYPTPAWMAYSLLGGNVIRAGVIPKTYTIWEPAAGSGVLVDAARAMHYNVIASDIHPNPHVNNFDADFLKLKTGDLPDDTLNMCSRLAIWTNPPFGDRCKLAEKFIEHALKLTEPILGMVIMLGRSDFDFARSRKHLFGDSPIFAGRLNMSKRPRWIEGTTGAPRFNYSWYWWDHLKEAREPPIVLYDYYRGDDD